MTEEFIHKVGRIDQIVRDFFKENTSINEIQAKELMPLFIEKGIFNKNYRDGLPIRNLLRTLDSENRLDLFSHCFVERKPINRYWYFRR